MYQFIGPIRPGQKLPTKDSVNLPSSSSAAGTTSSSSTDHNNIRSNDVGEIGKIKKPKKFLRVAGGTTWEDLSLSEWDPDDYRIFCGDLGNEVTDEMLVKTFEKYPSFSKARIIRDKRSGKTRGYGFASFKDPLDYARAIKEWDGKYVGSRPIKLRKSTWRDRNVEVKREKMPSSVKNLDLTQAAHDS